MLKFYTDKECADCDLDFHKEHNPTSKMQVFELSGLVDKSFMKGFQKQQGGFVIASKEQFTYEDKDFIGFCTTNAGKKAFENHIPISYENRH